MADLGQLGLNIKKLRKARGMTQEELANKAKTTKQSILKIEKGETIPLSTTLYTIAMSLGTTMETLFSEDAQISEASEHMVLELLRKQSSFIELHRSILDEGKEKSEEERKLLLSELNVENLKNKELYQLILLKHRNELEQAQEKYLESKILEK